MIDKNFEDSPFFVADNGKKSNKITIAYHPTKEFKKQLLDFKQRRYGDLSDSDFMNRIVKNYYFKFAHESRSYGKTIVAVIHEHELASADPSIIPMFVLNRYPTDNKHEVIIDKEIIAKNNLLEYVAWNTRFGDANKEIRKDIVERFYSDGFAIDEFEFFKNSNNDFFDDLFVLEIPLNNYLDSKNDEVYCYFDSHSGNGVDLKHVGVAIVHSNVKDNNARQFPIVYTWSLNEDFSIRIHKIVKVSFSYMEMLCEKYNRHLFNDLMLFEIGIDDKLNGIRQTKRRLQEQLDRLDKQEQALLISRDNGK